MNANGKTWLATSGKSRLRECERVVGRCRSILDSQPRVGHFEAEEESRFVDFEEGNSTVNSNRMQMDD